MNTFIVTFLYVLFYFFFFNVPATKVASWLYFRLAGKCIVPPVAALIRLEYL